jgi:hypothetical protein
LTEFRGAHPKYEVQVKSNKKVDLHHPSRKPQNHKTLQTTRGVKVGLVQKRRFLGNSTDFLRGGPRWFLAGWIWLVLASSAIAEHFQPVRVGLASQQLRRTFIDALGMFAPQKSAVIQEELQYLQVAAADLAT